MNNYLLKTNPFRVTPALASHELIWAGFPTIKEKFEKRILRSIKIPNSTLVLNWGEYGSGKTHSSRFFNRIDILASISSKASLPPPYSLTIVLPKGKNPTYEIFISIIDKLDIETIRTNFGSILPEIKEHIKCITDNIHIKSILETLFSSTIEPIILKKYLYGSSSTDDNKKLATVNILRQLNSDSDLTKLLSGLFSCLTLNKKFYSCIIIWIDEFEDIAIFNNVNIDKTNNFIRELLDNTPNNLLLFLNLTQSALINIEDLGQYLSEAVKSRIKDRINFEIPSEEDLLKYLNELLNNPLYRVSPPTTDLFPFEEQTIKQIIRDLGNISLRKFNDALSLLLEIGELEEIPIINMEFYLKNKTEIIGWKNE